MASFFSRLMGLTEAEHRGCLGQVDGALMARHTYGVASDLIAVDVHADDVGDYSVTESGWYAVDDAGVVVLGPFDDLDQCERAIADRKQIAS